MARKLKFDINIDTNALLCPNPNEFYSKAYISEDIVGNYRTLAGIKYKTKIANVLFDSLLKASTCTWSATDSTLDAIDIDVCPLSAMAQICRFDIEQSFVSAWMAKGASAPFDVNAFMSYYWDEMSKEIGAEIEAVRWRGNTAGSTGTYLDECDGYEVKLCADPAVIQIASTTVNASNVIAQMNLVYSALTPALQGKRNDLRWYVSSNVYAAFLQATYNYSNANIPSINGGLVATWLGIKIVLAEGASNNTMVLTHRDNMIYAFDGDNDSKVLKSVNLEDTVAEPILRTRVDLKMGFFYTNPAEIVFYSAGPCS
jgi:hypothetical protein